LAAFLEKNLDAAVGCFTARNLVKDYIEYEKALEANSMDHIGHNALLNIASSDGELSIKRIQPKDVRTVAELHYAFFGSGEMHGYSVAKLGPEFLEDIFYRLNLDNPLFFCDVAKYQNEVIGFTVYTTNRKKIFHHLLRKKFLDSGLATLKVVLRKPMVLPLMLSNLRYLRGEDLSLVENVMGWWLVAAVKPEYRTKEFEQNLDAGPVALQMFKRMESTMQQFGCYSWYGVVHPENRPINIFLQRGGAHLVGTAQAQGMNMSYYVKTMEHPD
jgi:hypothetical protein